MIPMKGLKTGRRRRQRWTPSETARAKASEMSCLEQGVRRMTVTFPSGVMQKTGVF
jgi:hypothetical protein